MIGTVFGDWLAENFQAELLAIKNNLHRTWDGNKSIFNDRGLYGSSYDSEKNKVSLDGGCGISSMITIAEAIGLEVNYMPTKSGRTLGFYVSLKK